MRKTISRLGAVTGLLAFASVTTGAPQADASVPGSCGASGVHAACATSSAFIGPQAIAVNVTSARDQGAAITWTMSCVQGSTQKKASGSLDAQGPYVHTIPHPFQDPDYCSVVATVYTDGYRGTVNLTLWASQTPAHDISGYQDTCVTASSAAMRAKAVISDCNGSASQNWAFTKGELMHAGRGLNDRGAGGNGSPVIMYSCTHAADETWTHNTRGQYVLRAHNGTLCLTDPSSSARNGTQLTVSRCSTSAGQRWSLPVAR